MFASTVTGLTTLLDKMIAQSRMRVAQDRQDELAKELMRNAAQGQSPQWLLISSIGRAAQDLDMWNVKRGEMFCATRIPGTPVLTPSDALVLYGGPVEYFHHFPDRVGAVMTFEMDESKAIVDESVRNITNGGLHDCSVVALEVDYESATVEPIAFNLHEPREFPGRFVSYVKTPSPVDARVLVVMCSDSRICPPETPDGVPMVIRTLGGYLPPYADGSNETTLLNRYLRVWLTGGPADKHIVIVAHGDFGGGGQPCGAARAALDPCGVHGECLRAVIQTIRNDTMRYERTAIVDPESSARSIAETTRRNIMSYPAVAESIRAGTESDELVGVLLMDTVTNELFHADLSDFD